MQVIRRTRERRFEAEIERANVLDDGCIAVARVLESHQPLRRREIEERFHFASHPQCCERIGPAQSAVLPVPSPAHEEFAARSSIEHEGEGKLCGQLRDDAKRFHALACILLDLPAHCNRARYGLVS